MTAENRPVQDKTRAVMHNGNRGHRHIMSEKNVSMTFRLSAEDVGALRDRAEEEEISLNTLVSQVIRSFLEWDSIASKTGMVPMQKHILRELYSYVPDAS